MPSHDQTPAQWAILEGLEQRWRPRLKPYCYLSTSLLRMELMFRYGRAGAAVARVWINHDHIVLGVTKLDVDQLTNYELADPQLVPRMERELVRHLMLEPAHE